MSMSEQTIRGPALGRNPLRALLSPTTWAAIGYLITGFPIGLFAFTAVVVLIATGGGLAPVAGVGLIVLVGGLALAGGIGAFERGRLAATLGITVAAPTYRRAPGGFAGWVGSYLKDRARWRAVAYTLVMLPLTTVGAVLAASLFAGGLVGVTLPIWARWLPGPDVSVFGDWTATSRLVSAAGSGLVLLLVAPWVTLLAARACAGLVRGLLGPSRGDALAERVEELRDSRTRVVDAADEERRRIERDLHDGAQQRLVALAVDLGRARARLEAENPGAATETTALIAEAHEQAKQTLRELRDLVRGIHPAILTDRGLDAALSALAARCPVPVTVAAEIPAGRCSPSVEAVAYFVVAEALTNVAKHSDATRVVVRARLADSDLVVSVTDDGQGGANPRGGGLRGLTDRVRALDGELTVDSPPGGPTTVTARVPCA
jgi:signal transduction histidine kinase